MEPAPPKPGVTSRRIANPANLNRRVAKARKQWLAAQAKGRQKLGRGPRVRRLLLALILSLVSIIVLWVVR